MNHTCSKCGYESTVGAENWICLGCFSEYSGTRRIVKEFQFPKVLKQYHVEGSKMHDFRSMCDAFGAAVGAPNSYFGWDLRTFDDCFFGYIVEFETPCEFVWRNSEESKGALDSQMLLDYCLEGIRESEHPESIIGDEGLEWLYTTLANAENGYRTMFDEIVDGVRSVTERSLGRVLVKLVLK